MVGDEERFSVVLLLAHLEHGQARLDDVDLRTECSGERQDLGLTTPDACILDGIAVVEEMLFLRLLAVERAGFLVNDPGHVFVRVRDERFVFGRMRAHLLRCRSTRRFVVGTYRAWTTQIQLVRYSRVQAVSVRRDLVHGHAKCRAHGIDPLAFDRRLVRLARSLLDFLFGLTSHLGYLGRFALFSLLLTADLFLGRTTIHRRRFNALRTACKQLADARSTRRSRARATAGIGSSVARRIRVIVIVMAQAVDESLASSSQSTARMRMRRLHLGR